MRKGDTVFYHSSRQTIKAKVLVMHRDGTAKVEAKFFHDEGKDHGCYLGYTYDGVAVYPNAMAADNAAQLMRRG